MKSIAEITKNMTDWQPPVIPENIAHGDMPGDKVEIGEGHLNGNIVHGFQFGGRFRLFGNFFVVAVVGFL